MREPENAKEKWLVSGMRKGVFQFWEGVDRIYAHWNADAGHSIAGCRYLADCVSAAAAPFHPLFPSPASSRIDHPPSPSMPSPSPSPLPFPFLFLVLLFMVLQPFSSSLHPFYSLIYHSHFPHFQWHFSILANAEFDKRLFSSYQKLVISIKIFPVSLEIISWRAVGDR